MADPAAPLAIGEALPALALLDCNGEEVALRSDRVMGNPVVLALAPRAEGALVEALGRALGEAAERLRAEGVLVFLVAPEAWDAGRLGVEDTRRNLRLLVDPARRLKVRTDAAEAEAFLLVAAPNGRVSWGYALKAETLLERVAEAVETARALVTRARPALVDRQPPVLTLEKVLEPALCEALLAQFAKPVPAWPKRDLKSGGFTAETGDFKIREHEPHARLTEHVLREPSLVRPLAQRFRSRVVPEIAKAFQVQIAQQEPFRIVRYDGAEGGFVAPHRDNPTAEMAHRKFTISVVLNTGQFQGGVLRFPEYGAQGYVMPVGGAVVWSASLLHEVTPVTGGMRYMLGAHLY